MNQMNRCFNFCRVRGVVVLTVNEPMREHLAEVMSKAKVGSKFSDLHKPGDGAEFASGQGKRHATFYFMNLVAAENTLTALRKIQKMDRSVYAMYKKLELVLDPVHRHPNKFLAINFHGDFCLSLTAELQEEVRDWIGEADWNDSVLDIRSNGAIVTFGKMTHYICDSDALYNLYDSLEACKNPTDSLNVLKQRIYYRLNPMSTQGNAHNARNDEENVA